MESDGDDIPTVDSHGVGRGGEWGQGDETYSAVVGLLVICRKHAGFSTWFVY